jgi:hypothetical protein
MVYAYEVSHSPISTVVSTVHFLILKLDLS